jgi:signal transduction histidine kinase
LSLRWRWTLALAVVSAGWILVVLLAVQLALRQEQRDESQRWRDSRRLELHARLELMGRQADDLVELLAASDELLALLAPLAWDEGTRGDAIGSWMGRNRARFELDQILVLDEAGTVLGSALWPELHGRTHPNAGFLWDSLPHSPVLWQSLESDGPRWLLGAVRRLNVVQRSFLVAGALRMDGPALQEIRALLDLKALRWADEGAGSATALVLPAGWQLQPATPSLWVDAGVPRSLLALDALQRRLLALGGLALLSSILLAPWLGMNLARPLTRLAGAVREVGRGRRQADDLDLPSGGPSEIRELSRALEELGRELDVAEERMRGAERRAAWREIAQRIAHEIRNVLSPLSLALDNVETAVHRDDPSGRRALTSSLRTARDQLESLQRLVGEFSSFARGPQLALAPLDVEAFVESALDAARAAYPQRRFELCRGPSIAGVRADAEQLRRALHNLLKNAAEAAPGGGVELDYGEGPDSDQWWLAVRDQGPGLASEVVQRMGEPYVSTKEGGTGLGLPVVLQIVEAHGGRLEWNLRPEGGLEMRIIVPRQPSSPNR